MPKASWKFRRAEIVALGRERGFEVLTTEEEWLAECTGAFWCPLVQCLKPTCREIVTTSKINSLHQGQNIGCACHYSRARHFRNRRAEIVAIGRARGFEVLTTEEEWLVECAGRDWCPLLQCGDCGELVTTTTVHGLTSGRSIGCKCNTSLLQHWKYRRGEVEQIGHVFGFEILVTDEEWLLNCTGKDWCPRLCCVKPECHTVVTTTTINHLRAGQNIGCPCNSTSENHWRDRRHEIVAIGLVRNFTVITPDEVWRSECTNNRWCPTLRCADCDKVTNTTRVVYIQRGHSINCLCRNKTEAMLVRWCADGPLPDVEHNTLKYKRPSTGGTLSFDMHSPSDRIILECDGEIDGGHFDDTPGNDTPVRDLEKERWGLAHDYDVIRLLQLDVWGDKNGWEAFARACIADIRHRRRLGYPRKVWHPDAPQYLGGVYARLRATSSGAGPSSDAGPSAAPVERPETPVPRAPRAISPSLVKYPGSPAVSRKRGRE